MKRKSSLKLALVSAAMCGLALSASAQSITNTPAATPPADAYTLTAPGYGLLGQDYAGVEFGYTHHIDGPPSVLHRYGFVANRPTIPSATGTNIDAMFRYDYTTGSESGVHAWQHDVLIGGTGFLNLNGFKPFIEGNVGWSWADTNITRDNDSFVYLVGAGAEFQLAQRLSLAPYVNFQERPHFGTRGWTYGAKAAFRVSRQWSALLGGEMDENHNIEYRVAWNRHF